MTNNWATPFSNSLLKKGQRQLKATEKIMQAGGQSLPVMNLDHEDALVMVLMSAAMAISLWGSEPFKPSHQSCVATVVTTSHLASTLNALLHSEGMKVNLDEVLARVFLQAFKGHEPEDITRFVGQGKLIYQRFITLPMMNEFFAHYTKLAYSLVITEDEDSTLGDAVRDFHREILKVVSKSHLPS